MEARIQYSLGCHDTRWEQMLVESSLGCIGHLLGEEAVRPAADMLRRCNARRAREGIQHTAFLELFSGLSRVCVCVYVLACCTGMTYTNRSQGGELLSVFGLDGRIRAQPTTVPDIHR